MKLCRRNMRMCEMYMEMSMCMMRRAHLSAAR